MAEAPLPDSALDLQSTLDHALSVVRTAAAELARLSHTELRVERKSDGSPVTNADHASHQILSQGLSALGIPVVSEEGGRTPHAERRTWSRMWLVDPLDGTGSFIRMRSGYAINVALIESDGHEWHPILGIVALPNLDRVYFGGVGLGTWKARIDDAARPPTRAGPRGCRRSSPARGRSATRVRLDSSRSRKATSSAPPTVSRCRKA